MAGKKGVPFYPGGYRPGSGRKPAAATKLKKTLSDRVHWAMDALELCREFANDPGTEKGIRLAAAKEVMDRIWGKSVQKVGGTDGGTLKIELINFAVPSVIATGSTDAHTS
jgi:hypothetical protein